jgi:Integrase core domain
MAVRSLKMSPIRTSFESPWQNGVAERWVGSCRRDLLDQIIAVNERHLKRLLWEYVRCHHEDRTHLGLGKGTPNGRIRSVASRQEQCEFETQLLRIATMGSIREARRAGRYPASRATPSSTGTMATNGTGSPAVEPNSNDCIACATTSEAAVPITRPTASKVGT